METQICTGCGKEKPLEEFDWKYEARGKRRVRCKFCRSEYYKAYYREHAEEQKARVRRNKQRTRAGVRGAIAKFKSAGCQVCGEPEHCCLIAHHLDPAQKDFSIAQAACGSYSVQRVQREQAKCVCLCANCHRKLHAGKIALG